MSSLQVIDENSAVQGFRMFLRTEEIWRIMHRGVAFHNWFTKLCPGHSNSLGFSCFVMVSVVACPDLLSQGRHDFGQSHDCVECGHGCSLYQTSRLQRQKVGPRGEVCQIALRRANVPGSLLRCALAFLIWLQQCLFHITIL